MIGMAKKDGRGCNSGDVGRFRQQKQICSRDVRLWGQEIDVG